MGYSKSSYKKKLKAINAYMKKQERSSKNNLTLQLRELEKELSPKLVEERKQQRSEQN